jgi:hypothetical protein
MGGGVSPICYICENGNKTIIYTFRKIAIIYFLNDREKLWRAGGELTIYSYGCMLTFFNDSHDD